MKMEQRRPHATVALCFFLAFSLLLIARPAHGEKQDEKILGSPSSCKVNESKGDEQWEFMKGLSQEDAVIKWIQSLEGGIVNNELFEIQRIDQKDGSLNPEFDFVASSDISKGTVLMEIPPEAMIGGILTSAEESAFDKFTQRTRHTSEMMHVPICMAIERILNEHQKESLSSYHPYLEFIFGSGNPKHRKPIEWHDPFYNAFWTMMGWPDSEYSPTQEHYGLEYTQMCETYKKQSRKFRAKKLPVGKEHRDLIEGQAFGYFFKHAWGTSMIPLFDMIPHRNGKWKNVEALFIDIKTNTPVALKPRDKRFEGFRKKKKEDNSNSKSKLVVYADRHIAKGEPLRISLNQCKHLGCEHLKLNYITSDLLTDTGILEEYPRRWSFRMDGAQNFILDIDLDSSSMDPQRRTVRVLQSNTPVGELEKIAFFDASRYRWRDLQRELEEIEREEAWDIATARQKHQYDTLHAIQRGYAEAFELAWLHRYDSANLDQTSQNTTQNTLEGYDDLSERMGPALHSKGGYLACLEGEPDSEKELLAKIKTSYQELEYFHQVGYDDTYMKMAGWTHSGSNFRAHYHESVIHMALQYVENPKRVAYIGGGDNMILAELFKYDSIEKIVGLELDQQVCRSSMKYFGTSPSYHDERVEWWYGNGALSLQLFPEEYFGSFDLVLVDLLTDVADAIKVTAGLTISEVATLLMKPHGVLARNDDFLDRSEISQHLANRVVMYDFYDTPHMCETGTTLVSNSVDFVKGPRYDHEIETLVRNTDFENERFAGWARYYDSSDISEKSAYDKSNFEAQSDIVCQGIKTSLKEHHTASSTSNGILLIIEAENVTKSLEPEMLPQLHEMIKEVAIAYSLHPLAISHQPKNDVNAFTLFCERGYIKMQTYPQFEYVAFDLVLWGDSLLVGKSNYIQNDLIALVGGGSIEGSVSNFRVVTGGMASAKTSDDSNNHLIEKALQYYCGDKDTEIDTEDHDDDINMKQEMSTQNVDQSFLFPQHLSDIMASLSPQIDQMSLFVIFCGKKDIEECKSYSSLSSNNSTETANEQVFIPIYSCQSFDQMPDCESEIKEILEDSVSEHKLFDGFIVDPSVSLHMGKIIHKIFNNTLYQSQIFEYSFSGVAKGGTQSWTDVFLDRFRTEMVIAPPVRMAELELSNGTHIEAWSVVSVHIHGFWDRLHNFIEVIERKTGLITKTRKVLDSIKPMIPDWNPNRPTDYDFFREEVMDQWLGQRPVANQFFLQMEVGSTPAPAEVGEVVLVGEGFWEDGLGGFILSFHEGTIAEVHGREKDRYIAKIEPFQLADGRTIELKYQTASADKTIPRHQIRKISRTEANRQLNIGDFVLAPRPDPTTKEAIPITWIASHIIEINENGISVRPKSLAGDEESADYTNLSRDNIMPYLESPEFTIRKEALSLAKLESTFERSALESGIARNDTLFETFKVNNGHLMSFVSQMGSGTMKWDGLYNVEVNILATEGRFEEHFESTIKLFKETFLSNLPSLNLIAQDSFPRGFGKVVNFRHEIVDFEDDEAPSDYIPKWMEA